MQVCSSAHLQPITINNFSPNDDVKKMNDSENFFPLAESLKIKPTEPTLFLTQRIFNSARLKKDKDSIRALPALVKAMQFAKENLELESHDIDEIDNMLNQSAC